MDDAVVPTFILLIRHNFNHVNHVTLGLDTNRFRLICTVVGRFAWNRVFLWPD